MVTLNTDKIKDAVKEAFFRICLRMDDDVEQKLSELADKSEGLEKFAFGIMTKNAEIARTKGFPLCQDTGMAVVFLDIGQDVVLTGEYVEDAVNKGVREAYVNLRKSVLSPLERLNTEDNTPAVIHTRIVEGDSVTVSCMAKGFGSENMSRVFMLTPADGTDGIVRCVTQCMKDAGSCPCPPVILGVGIGGTMEKAALMSKHALFRTLGSLNKDAKLAELEAHILKSVNALGIGAQGLGGPTTALAVFAESYPTHIAGLPVAVTVQCHASRHSVTVIKGEK